MTTSLKLFFNSLLYKTNRFQVTVRLFSNRSQRTSKCAKSISTTPGCASCATFLPHFDVICNLLLNRRTATWNLFVNQTCNSTRPDSRPVNCISRVLYLPVAIFPPILFTRRREPGTKCISTWRLVRIEFSWGKKRILR